MMLLTGSAKPMVHQLEDVRGLEAAPRVNVWNGLGTGKMFTGAWIVQRWWLEGRVDCCIVVAPSMCGMDWTEAFESKAWPEGLAYIVDARPPDHEAVTDFIGSNVRQDPSRLHVFITSYGGLKSAFGTRTASRFKVELDSPVMASLRGRKVAIIFDESQAAALPTSQQGVVARAIADASRHVISMTATPIGNPLSMRLWGMASLVRPDILHSDASVFSGFKERYGILVDPVNAADPSRPFVAARAYPRGVHQHLIDTEVLAPMAPFTVLRLKEECLDLPPKVRLRRAYRAQQRVLGMMRQLAEEDRVILANGHTVLVENALEERLRTLELASGWIEDRIVHQDKFDLLKRVLEEVDDNVGSNRPVVIWASRTREILACALVCVGVPPDQAMERATAAAASDQEYRQCVLNLGSSVAVLHGRTTSRDRDRIQTDWKAGRIRIVVAHPGVAGAGLNWQHVTATIYFSQPLGTIARQQSEDRVHRHGLKHTALYYDLVMEGGPDAAVARAHAEQASASAAMLRWVDGIGRSSRM